MKQVNEGRRITVGTRDHVGVDTEVLLRRIQIAKSHAGDKKFRWKKQNDPAEVLGTLIEGIQQVLTCNQSYAVRFFSLSLFMFMLDSGNSFFLISDAVVSLCFLVFW